jgi:hypothetical protein
MHGLGCVPLAAACGDVPVGTEVPRRSLPVSPFDYPSTLSPTLRSPLSPLPDGANICSGTPHFQARVESMRVWDLRQMIRQYGMKHADCGDLLALRARALEAVALSRQASASAPESRMKRCLQASSDNNSASCTRDGNRQCRRNDSFVSPKPSKCISVRLAATPDFDADADAELGHSQPLPEVPRRRSLTLMAPPPPTQAKLDCIPMSARMLYRLQCCAEESHLEVECSAEDIEWESGAHLGCQLRLRLFHCTDYVLLQGAEWLQRYIAVFVILSPF